MSALYCVLNAAEGQLDVLLAHEEHMLVAQSWHAPTRGAEILTPALQSLLRIQKLSPAHITHFACVHGPGSFTGLRLTMGTVAAIRRITNAVNASVDYMQALALTGYEAVSLSPNQEDTYTFCVLTHARRQLVHAQWYTCTANHLPASHAPAVLLSPQEVLKQWQDHTAQGQSVHVLGSGFERNTSSFENVPQGVHMLPLLHPSPQALLTLAKQATYHHHDLEPLYIRPCDAVENLDHIAQKQGMDGAKAHEKLATLLAKPTTSDI